MNHASSFEYGEPVMTPGEELMHLAADKLRSAVAMSLISPDMEYVLYEGMEDSELELGFIRLAEEADPYQEYPLRAVCIEIGVPLETKPKLNVYRPFVDTSAALLVCRRRSDTVGGEVYRVPETGELTRRLRKLYGILDTFELVPMRQKPQFEA